MTGESPPASSENLGAELRQYISICNNVIACNRQRFPFAQIWRALEDKLDGKPLEFVVARHEEDGHQWAVFLEGEIRVVEGSEASLGPVKAGTKKVALSYLKAVLDDPSRYIANPALIDWDWVFADSRAVKKRFQN